MSPFAFKILRDELIRMELYQEITRDEYYTLLRQMQDMMNE